jgi:hypothetical protein
VRRLTVVLGLTTLLGAARAEDPPSGQTYTVDGSATAGYRFVDVDGSTAKYREDYNLHEGPVLFGLDLNGVSHAPEKTPVDRFHLQVDTPGNEPASVFRLSAADRERYDLRVNFTRSKYFYAVPREFEHPVAGDVRLDDLHDFNTVRTDGSVDLTVRTPDKPTLLLGYRLYERSGDTTSTIRIPGGDTFPVNAPLDSTTHVGHVGTEFRALGTDVFLQQEYRRVDRDLNRHGPLDAGKGVDPADASVLTSFKSNQAEHLDVPATTVRLRHPLGDDLDLTGAYFYSHADLSFRGGLLRTGTSDAPAFSGTERATDHGSATLDTHVADVGATWRALEWLRFHGAYRFNERSEGGNLTAPSTYGLLATVAGDHVRVHTVTGDAEVDPRDDLSLRAGARYARRDAYFSATGLTTATTATGAIGDIKYRPCTFADLYLRYEGAQVDDPLVVPGDPLSSPALSAREITLTFVNRGTTGVHLRPRDWVTLSYELVAESRENSSFDANSQSYGNSVGIALQPLAGLTVYAGYTRRDFDNRADILIAPLYTPTRSLQRGNEDVFTSTLDYDFTLAGQSWSTGWNVAYVNAHNTLAPRFESGMLGLSLFDLDRVDGGTFLTWHNKLLEPSIELRMVDYTERVLPGNDYRATIVALKLRKGFTFGF